MSGAREAKAVQTLLEETAQSGPSAQQQLVFDPTSGQLVVQRIGAAPRSPDAVVADSIAGEGFFGSAAR